MPTIKGKLRWLHNLWTPDAKYGGYSVAVEVDREEFGKVLKEHKCGQNMRESQTDPGLFEFVFKKPSESRDGTEAYPPPIVVDSHKNVIKSNIRAGNGTEGVVQFRWVPYKDKEGERPELEAVQIIKLVEYQKPLEFGEEDGYSVGGTEIEEII